MRNARIWAAIASASVIVAACGGSGSSATQAPTIGPASQAPTAAATHAATAAATTAATGAPATAGAPSKAPSTPSGGTIGPGEGELDLVIWTGYAERGLSDPAYDWVTPFETDTGCKVNTTDMTDSNNGVSLIQSGAYDGISASGDATTRLIQGGYVSPIDTSMLSNYADVFDGLKNLPHNTVDGVNYGTPHGRGPNLLMYNTDVVTTAPTSWDPIWEGGADYKGKISIYDSSIFIADAALHAMVKHPELGITDIYQLNDAQFQAAIDLLNQLKANNPQYWGTATDQVNTFTSGDTVIGTSWQYQANLLTADKQPINAVLPDEGSTGWSDTWMMYSHAAHPNCMLQWMNWMMSPVANAQATVWFGEAPVTPQACAEAEKISPGHCDQMHATDEAYFSKVHYWATPQEDCKDADPATTCKTQDDWVQAWTTLTGS